MFRITWMTLLTLGTAQAALGAYDVDQLNTNLDADPGSQWTFSPGQKTITILEANATRCGAGGVLLRGVANAAASRIGYRGRADAL